MPEGLTDVPPERGTHLSGRSDPGPDSSLIPERVALVGMGVTNRAVARALVARGHDVVGTDDGGSAGAELAEELGFEFFAQPDAPTLAGVLGRSGAYVATPGLADSHPVFELARELQIPGLSEFDLAAAWDQRALLAVTGTNGKTTVAMLTEAMLERCGIATEAVGNLDVPLVNAIDDPRPSCFVVEASSFRLARSAHFSARVGTWLNFSPDHLDVHRDLQAYRRAKERIWLEQDPGSTAVHNSEDPIVSAAAAEIVAGRDGVRSLSFALASSVEGRTVDFHESGGVLFGPDGTELLGVSDLWSNLPHDRRNVLAAAATAWAGGAEPEGIAQAAAEFSGLPHRVQLVGESDGVRFFDDSKATTPHATLSALEGFDRVVLIAGGRNKGLDLSEMHSAENVVAVVGIGEAAGDVLAGFGRVPAEEADSMAVAVRRAADLAVGGDVVLLSPGCASFDWYGSYGERGDDFASEVRNLVADGERRSRS